ncbi:MAG: hypothetical protein Q8L93_03905 [Rhodocyclaceae bacterium]|nr:hypothetical protein [Rhodocyclaceae bacterium]
MRRPASADFSAALQTSTFMQANWRTPTLVLICGGLMLTLAMGVRTYL